MASSEQSHQAWKKGYIDGYRTIKSTIPSIPSMPSYPGSVDPITYYYNLGREKGIDAARK